jgi:hypothetical protein
MWTEPLCRLAAERGIVLTDRWTDIIRARYPTLIQGDMVITSDAFGLSCAERHRAHTGGQASEALVRAAVQVGGLEHHK